MSKDTKAAEKQREIERDVPLEVRDQLYDYPNVVDHGVGYVYVNQERKRTVGIVAIVDGKVPENNLNPGDVIPRDIEGYRVDVRAPNVEPAQTGQSARNQLLRPLVGSIRITAPNVTGCTSCLWGVIHDGVEKGVTNAHCVDDVVGAPVYNPGDEEPENHVGDADELTDPSEDFLDVALVTLEEGIEGRTSSLAVGPYGTPELPVLGERYFANTGRWGCRTLVCTMVTTGTGSSFFEFPDGENESWAGSSGSLISRLDENFVVHPVCLLWGSGAGSISANNWIAIDDHFDGITIPNNPGQPSPDLDDEPSHETLVYDFETNGLEVTLSVLSCNSGGESDSDPVDGTTARSDIVVRGWGSDPDDEGELVTSLDVENEAFESNHHEVTIPLVQAYRGLAVETEWNGEVDHHDDMELLDPPGGSYLGFASAEFDAPEYHPGGSVGIDYQVKNAGESDGDTDVDLLINETTVDTINTGTLSTGESDVDTLEWPVDSGDIGTHDVEVQTEDETIDLGTVEVQPLTITVEVHDDGTPIQGADIYVINTTDPESYEVEGTFQTDSSGEIDEDFDSGRYHVLVYENGFNALSRGFVEVSTHIEFALESYTAPVGDNVNFEFNLIPEDVPLSAHGELEVEGTGELEHEVPLSAHGELEVEGTGELEHEVSLSAHGELEVEGTGALIDEVDLSAHGEAEVIGEASLSHEYPLSAHGEAEIVGEASLSNEYPLSAHGTMELVGEAAFQIGGPIDRVDDAVLEWRHDDITLEIGNDDTTLEIGNDD